MVKTAEEFRNIPKPEKKNIVACLTDMSIDGQEIKERFQRDGVEIIWDAAKSYGISEADGALKWSEDFSVCLGAIIAGTNKFGENISILLHILPNLPLTDRRFLPEFQEKMKNFMRKVDPDSIEIAIFGGRIDQPDSKEIRPQSDEYEKGIRNLASFLKLFTGKSARVLAMPRVAPRGGHKVDAAYDTPKKRLFIIRNFAAEGDERRTFSPEEMPEIIESLNVGGKKNNRD